MLARCWLIKKLLHLVKTEEWQCVILIQYIMVKDKQLLKGYLTEDGKFDRMPGKRQKKKLAIMLQCLAQKFEVGKRYTEMEVNEILNRQHSFNDPATLRRLMFGSGLINRTLDGRSYWMTN